MTKNRRKRRKTMMMRNKMKCEVKMKKKAGT
jgi:hypothetical protein